MFNRILFTFVFGELLCLPGLLIILRVEWQCRGAVEAWALGLYLGGAKPASATDWLNDPGQIT